MFKYIYMTYTANYYYCCIYIDADNDVKSSSM